MTKLGKIVLHIGKLISVEYFILSFILIIGLAARLYKINNPVADWHSWRQADTASVSRNFISRGIDVFSPRYHDISTVQTGIFNPEGYRLVEPDFNIFHTILAKRSNHFWKGED
jgi:hypothetical protein